MGLGDLGIKTMQNILIKPAADGISMKGKVVIRAYKAGTKELIQEIIQDNLIMTGSGTGRDLIIQWLLTAYYNANPGVGITPIAPGISYIAIGTGSTTPASGDTQLTTETNRAIVSFASDLTNNEAQFQALFPDGILTNGTIYKEAGAFVGGSATLNTGNIFNHALFGTTYTKAAGTDTTVEIDITLT